MTLNKEDLVGVTILEAILAEKERQVKVYGEQNHDDSWWNLITTDKNGDVVKEIFKQSDTKLFIELVELAATYFSWAESVRRRHESG
tara:strand:+ start:98 stop:358 length:261 start_codon:yes stop_codon:yes gene_type:complete